MLGLDLKGIGVSAGSACTSGSVEPSYVLVAMGVPVDWAMGAVRCSLGRARRPRTSTTSSTSCRPLCSGSGHVARRGGLTERDGAAGRPRYDVQRDAPRPLPRAPERRDDAEPGRGGGERGSELRRPGALLPAREGDRVREARFQTYGCGPSIAASSIATELVRDRSVEALGELTPEAVESALGGLPEDRRHAATMVVDALRSALRHYRTGGSREAKHV